MSGWWLEGEELPFGGDRGAWWVDGGGLLSDRPVADADRLPGRFVLPGLVDAHAHPAIGEAGTGRQPDEIVVVLRDWCAAGVLFVRDVGSPGSATLRLGDHTGVPVMQAAGRFLAPAGRYFPHLYEPVDEQDLVEAALAEIRAGAQWVKVIADFPDLEAGTPPEPTYAMGAIAALATAAHGAGARVAAHSTIDNVVPLVRAGVDSIEHGTGIDDDAFDLMAARGVAWTPTITALLAFGGHEPSPEQRRRIDDAKARLREYLPRAVQRGLPVMAGTDASGSVADEVASLAAYGLEPAQALAAASTWAQRFLRHPSPQRGELANLVTYQNDPRDDPTLLHRPAAVISRGRRII